MGDNNKVQGILDTTVEKMRSMANADTIIGEPKIVGEGITLIPVSKVSYGFASGGSDFSTKSSNGAMFGGGGGGGMTVTPVAFVVINNGNVRIVNINTSETALDKAVGIVPDVVDKIKDIFKSKKEDEE